MASSIITPEDLRNFKQELLEEIQKLLAQKDAGPVRRWMKSPEVRKLLNVSPGTLQNLRVNGTLPFTKIGGAIYYDYEDIREMLESRKQSNRIPDHPNSKHNLESSSQ
ncbi:MAG TPA: helix-turn-helix domain-containing protein [Cyclobacteriaceae bacterium]|nr:helix-turn-helix domain-containing protein [Cyclobacteriaceae bacterium]